LKLIVNQKIIEKGLSRLKREMSLEARARKYSYEQPLRSELFSIQQLERHAVSLAKWHEVDPNPNHDKLLNRLAENEEILLQVYELLTEAAEGHQHTAPAAFWLLDNFYKVEEQIRTARRHLPKSYSRQLPHLMKGPLAGFPRAYDLARELVLHLDGQIDAESLRRFIEAYQTLRVLSIGELWAIPIMLRLALIENLRRVSIRIALNEMDRVQADKWADRIIEAAERDPKSVIMVVADMAGSDPPMSSAFVAEMFRRLQGQSLVLEVPLKWMEERLSEIGLTVEQSVQSGVQQDAADRVSIGNSIESFRLVDSLDWRGFVEEASLVERTLRMDPDRVYGRMDFATRDRYRHVVERLAKRSPLSEVEVAKKALELAEAEKGANGASKDDKRRSHVGFYLVDRGIYALEEAIQAKRSLPEAAGKSHRLFYYLGSIYSITILITAAVLILAYRSGLEVMTAFLAGIPLIFCASSLAIFLVNWVVTIAVKPTALPRMDFSKGFPQEYRTLVVVPALLTSVEGIDHLLETLEIRYLANQDPNLFFGLLTDFRDAPQEEMPGDQELLLQARQGVEALGRKYHEGRFFFFHRPRRWNPQEKAWMGYERKRGSIEDLNSLLRGGPRDRFSTIVGDESILPGVKYVITLDEDTQMPRGSARLLVGNMAHPLNAPRYDSKRQCVTEGYSILQPLLALGLPQAGTSRFMKIFGVEPGVDPYTKEVSDVYQDLFKEGSFAGKGIYDVDAFAGTLSGRLPENLILSHDLLEGCYARAGLVSDVQFYEEFPHSYATDTVRRHRWIRGDWQISTWLLRRVPGHDCSALPNPLSYLSKWKVLDNLRRSLVPFAQIILLILGWTFFLRPFFWTFVVVGMLLVPPLIHFIADLLRKPPEMPLNLHLRCSFRLARKNFAQVGLNLIFLPYEAFFSLDAIVRTCFRMRFSRRGLLEWRTSVDSKRSSRGDLAEFYRIMWPAPLLSVIAGLYLIFFYPQSLYIAGIFLVLWFISPYIAWWISQPLYPTKAKLTKEQTIFLRKLSRKTWRFFETFIGPDNNWLPPDNYQEEPRSVVANGTSPTNMGLSLLSNLAAHDFGYISIGRMMDRLSRTFLVMDDLERFRGHFYNWYDTKLLKPLCPLYISTVDSGNLAGHLLILKQGLMEIPDQKIFPPQALSGLKDTLSLLLEAAKEEGSGPKARAPKEALFVLEGLQKDIGLYPDSLAEAWALLEKLSKAMDGLINSFEDEEASWWAQAFVRQINDFKEDLTLLTPWAATARPLPEEELKIPDEVRQGLLNLDRIPSLREVAELRSKLLPEIEQILGCPEDQCKKDEKTAQLQKLILEASSNASKRLFALDELANHCIALSEIEYDFLFDRARNMLSIGYNVQDLRRDASCYDLLASEARLTSFVAISQGILPQDHWFSLGRLMTTADGELVLLSWGGTMFEYLMPLLVMPSYENTLLDQTYRVVVERHREYGKLRGVPWGISESGYSMTDANLIYQYRAFGVPGLGFKRGLTEDLVIAPYASALALMVAPDAACSNLQQMAKDGYLGPYGFYEAVDFTPSRLPRDQSSTIVRSFMAHHQGMTFLSLLYVLQDRSMQRRFLSNPLFKATELLLQEKITRAAPFYPHAAEVSAPLWRVGMWEEREIIRAFDTPDTPMPEVHLLSNGKYSVMVTNAGAGYSRWKEIAITRWHSDSTCDSYGTFIYIRDLESGEFWSAGYQPTLKGPDVYIASFQESLARFWRQDNNIDSQMEIVVSPEDDIELRSIKITNRSWDRREIELTSYAEVALADPAADASHPAFSKLFVETEIIPSRRAILCHRRPRSQDEKNPWMFHLLTTGAVGDLSYETDRAKFLGRGRTAANPAALRDTTLLSDSDGPVLDPIIAIRCTLALEPGKAADLNFITGIAETRDAALQLMEKYQDIRMAERVLDMAWTHGQMILRQLNVTEEEVQRYEHLASAIVYPTYTWRASPSVIMSNTSGQSGLWGYGISGDNPIVLLKVGDRSSISLARQLILAHAYWRLMGLTVDLVIWNEDSSDYRQLLQDEIMGLISSSPEASTLDRPGGVFVRRTEQISDEAKVLMQTVARAIITDSLGSLEDQLDLRFCPVINIPPLETRWVPHEASYEKPKEEEEAWARGEGLIYWNGLGGFTPDGKEYIIKIPPEAATPAPWINVIANPDFGCTISESGGSCTWSENAHEFRLTPWYNDPVTDISGEALYIRDEETGKFWSPTAFPARGNTLYTCRHGFGYSVFEHSEGGIKSELWAYVAVSAPVKLMVLRLRNESNRPRRLSATYYLELVLGELRSKNAMHIITEIDARTGALLARNPYNKEFPDRIVFLDTNVTSRSFTGDRAEFLGRNGTTSSPIALTRVRLSGRVGAALDPCAACQVKLDLAEGEEREIIFTFGIGKDRNDARSLVQRFRGSGPARSALEAVWSYWNRTLGVVYVETEEKSLNMLANGWLMYQTLSSRLFARAGYYQSSGAYGFRDQLQDVMALLFADPGRAREHLLRCASRQFIEGDVQHWWHPHSGRGVRTRISDDYLWLPYVAYQYITATGDAGVLEEAVHFLEGRPLKPEEESYFDLPCASEKVGTLYEHCKRSIEWGLKFGSHGLPLMGSGDWNDGMNRVGFPGKGESVWLAFFLYDVLVKFFELAVRRGDRSFSELCVDEAAKLRKNIEDHGWDGDWYLRAYFDDGRPLGSLINTECKIDSLPQSWSVLSGASDPERTRMAMDALDRLLVRRDSALIQLFDPPFDVSDLEPGYIKGYVPGVRENGGQYTHAAIWAVMAFAQMGDCRRAWELLSLINPVNHGSTPEAIRTYRVEPYTVAADVYSVLPHTGKGGWTWYTGAASWMYRLIVEFLLGLRREADRLRFEPCLPPEWKSFKLHYRHYETFYHITVSQVVPGSPVTSVTVDGAAQEDLAIHLADDRKEHFAEVRMG
jgi:cyclic beta-1,2-glucan synthetase